MDAFCIPANMKTLTIKNVPDALYGSLTESARKNRRSLNSEAIVRLEQSVEPLEERERLERVRQFRESLPETLWLTDELLSESRAELVRRSERIVERIGKTAVAGRTRRPREDDRR